MSFASSPKRTFEPSQSTQLLLARADEVIE
jgi:hypothetical protein